MNFGRRKIQVSNLPELDGFEESKVEGVLRISFDKLQRLVNNEMLLSAHFKQHEADGKRAKSSVHLKLGIPGKTIIASETGWNPINVLQAALNVLERETVEYLKRR